MRKLCTRFAIFSMVACLFSCEDKTEETPSAFSGYDASALSQTVYADETTTDATFKFTASELWKITISNATRSKSWIEVNPMEGGVGKKEITISLEINNTGEDRAAEIDIRAGESVITVRVLQKAVTEGGEEPEIPNDSKGVVVSINGELIEYVDDFSCVKKIGEQDYTNKLLSDKEWVYVSYNINNNNNSNCDFTYDSELKLQKSEFLLDIHSASSLWKTEYGWDENILKYVKGDNYISVSTNQSLRTDLTYGEIIYTRGNIDINWLLATNDYAVGGVASAIGVRTTRSNYLLAGKVRNFEGDDNDKYYATYKYSYKFNDDGYISAIYENESKIYEFEYLSDAVSVSGIALNESEITLEVGESYSDLVATVLPENALNKNYTWRSSNPDVASVNESGLVVAETAGKTAITVITEDGSKTASCMLTVNDVPTTGSGTFTVSSSKHTQSYTIIRAKHTITSNRSVTLQFVSDKNTDAGILILNNPLSNDRLVAGRYTHIESLRSNNPNEDNTFDWRHQITSSSIGGIVNVAINGDIYTITLAIDIADDEKVTGSYVGTLEYTNEYVEVSGISLNKKTLELEVGESYNDLVATVLPENAFNKNYTWRSSDSDVASVSEYGGISAKAQGSTTITVTSDDGNKIASCELTVTPLTSTGSGIFSNDDGLSIEIKRATQRIDEKEPSKIRLSFYKENDLNDAFMIDLVRAASDNERLKAGTYTSFEAIKSELGGYARKGSITVAVKEKIYTVTLDLDIVDDRNNVTGEKITGTYTGKILE